MGEPSANLPLPHYGRVARYTRIMQKINLKDGLALVQCEKPLLDDSLQDWLSGVNLSHVVKKG